ncbi:mucin-5AC-like isoform X2 [Sitophilus oryzae]|uniref:Mucin-5AC-like isoform X2 n=1 Tax=Sitophilus oryzae TaxID=7048 RepID=A0A6J2YWP8_SITOR|nr:mucin-5AC-like isoform X2 [Sitophilus oryzae]
MSHNMGKLQVLIFLLVVVFVANVKHVSSRVYDDEFSDEFDVHNHWGRLGFHHHRRIDDDSIEYPPHKHFGHGHHHFGHGCNRRKSTTPTPSETTTLSTISTISTTAYKKTTASFYPSIDPRVTTITAPKVTSTDRSIVPSSEEPRVSTPRAPKTESAEEMTVSPNVEQKVSTPRAPKTESAEEMTVSPSVERKVSTSRTPKIDIRVREDLPDDTVPTQ